MANRVTRLFKQIFASAERATLLLLTFGTAVLFSYSYLSREFPEATRLIGMTIESSLLFIIVFFVESELLLEPTKVLLGITIPIFVLTVTLVGRAAKVAKQKQVDQNEASQKEQKEKIEALQERINSEPENVDNLEQDVRMLRKNQLEKERNLDRINYRYNALGFTNAVAKPSIGFALSLVFQELLYTSTNLYTQVPFLFLSVAFLAYGVKKIAFTLLVVQEISLQADEEQEKDLRNLITERLVGGLREVFFEMEKLKEPQPVIKFTNPKLPLVLKPNSEVEIAFEVDLEDDGPKEAHNVTVFIAFSPEIEIIEDPSYKIRKQRATYHIPSANSAAYDIKKVAKHTFCGRKLKIKTPGPGVYEFGYSVECSGHVEPETISEIIIKE